MQRGIVCIQIGEGAPNLRKGVCGRHLHDVKGLLKGIHVTINARNEDEVEADQVYAALGKATATSYDFTDRSEHAERNNPVVSGFIMGEEQVDKSVVNGGPCEKCNPVVSGGPWEKSTQW